MTFLSPTKIVASYNLQDPIGQADSEIFAVLGSTIEVIGEPGVVPINIVEGDDQPNLLGGGYGGYDSISGYGGNDTLNGFDGHNELYGGGGDDTLTVVAGINELYGGDGNDFVVSNLGQAQGYFYGDAGNDTFVIRLINSLGPNFFYGGSGNDYLRLDLSNQMISNSIHFQPGESLVLANNTIIQGFESLFLISGDGDDNYFFTAPVGYSDSQNGWYGDMWWSGGYDVAILDFSNITENMTASLGSSGGTGGVQIFTGSIFELRSVEALTFTSGTGDDTITGGSAGDYLVGNAGHDDLYSGGGDDFLSGGDGDDYLVVQGGNDSIYGDSGNDTVEVYYFFGVSSGSERPIRRRRYRHYPN